MGLTTDERAYLRALAKRVAEAARRPEEAEKARLWREHNSLKKMRPLILIFPEGAWPEILPEDGYRVEDPFYRNIERDLKMRLCYADQLKSDNVTDDVIHSAISISNTGWGIEARQVRPEESKGACLYEPVIKEERDIEKIRMPEVTVDRTRMEETFAKMSDLLGGILKVEKRGIGGHWFEPMDRFATYRGLNNLFLDLTERPAWVHEVMERLTRGSEIMFDAFEKLGVLSLNNGNHYVGSGGLGFTDELPQKDFDGKHVRPMDMWGHATSQIFAPVSPRMHEEFALRYERRWLSRFGLNCYGCCEPLHRKLQYVKTIPRLRRVSMSPWVDVEEAAAGLEDRYIFSYKPNPAVLAADTWEPDSVRKGLRDVLEKTRGCVLEMVMKDVHTCRNQPHRLIEWVRIAKETAESFA